MNVCIIIYYIILHTCILSSATNIYITPDLAQTRVETETDVSKKKGISPSYPVSVSEVNFDSNVEDIVWCGYYHTVVLLKTMKGRIYRSIDSGKQWFEITNNLKSKIPNPKDQESFAVENLIVNELDKSVVIVIGNSKNHFISHNTGAEFTLMDFPHIISTWLFHPTKGNWALVSTWTPACYDNNSKEDCYQELYYTKNLGRSFDLLKTYVSQFSWGDKSIHHEDTIYMTAYSITSGSQPRFEGWSSNIDFVATRDFGQSFATLVPGGNKFLVANGYIFVATTEDVVKQTVKLYVSRNGGSTFEMAKLPVSLEERSYTIIDTSEGAVVIHVNHSSYDTNVGNVYISDESGVNFSLSLPNNVRSSSGECEFDRIFSVEGVYIANFKDTSDYLPNPRNKFQPPASHEMGKEAETVKSKAKNEDVVRTVISFNKGGTWNYIKAPKYDSLGNRYDCEKNKCYLHLHGITHFHQYAPFYSVENAVGLVIGTGNVGDHLRYEASEVNTFLSNDGGLNWIEAHKGAFIYEFGDHGGLIVMADDQRKVNQVVFSWDHGYSWFDFELGKFPLDVDNIVIEPNSSVVEFLLYGTRNGIGVLYHLDFSTLGQPLCHGIWSVNSETSDYETWSPSDGTSNNCLLGKQLIYTRRKPKSACFNGKDYKVSSEKKICQCTREDFECNVGFTRIIGGQDCIPDPEAITYENCTSSGIFYADAYRKVPGDVCEGGWIPTKVPVPCPPQSPFTFGTKVIIFFMLCLILTLLAATWISKSPEYRHILRNYGFDSFQSVAYSPLGKKNYSDNSKFEPEFGFIDAEQDEEDAPALMQYMGSYQPPITHHPNSLINRSHDQTSNRRGGVQDNKGHEPLELL